MILEDLYAYLGSLPSLTAICSDRIYPVNVPQGATYPCVRFERDDDGGYKDMDGQGATQRTDIQIDYLADTLAQTTEMAAAVQAALKNHVGTFGTRYVYRVSLEAEFDEYDPKLPDGGKYRSSQAWTMWHA